MSISGKGKVSALSNGMLNIENVKIKFEVDKIRLISEKNIFITKRKEL